MMRIIKWFWSDPWCAENLLTTSDFFYRLGVMRVLICLGVFFVVINQGMHVLETDPFGISFYYFDRVPWFYQLLGVEKTYPLLDYVNFFVALAALLFAAAGIYFRTSISVAIICMFIIHGTRSGYSGNNHHPMFVWIHVLFILLFSQAKNAFAIARSNENNIEQWEAIWPVRFIQIVLVIFYFSAGLSKIRLTGMAWLIDGSGIQRILLNISQEKPIAQAIGRAIASNPVISWLLSLYIVLIEFLAPLLLVRKRSVVFFMIISYSLFHIGARFLVGVPFHFLIVLLLFYVDFVGIFQSVCKKNIFTKR